MTYIKVLCLFFSCILINVFSASIKNSVSISSKIDEEYKTTETSLLDTENLEAFKTQPALNDTSVIEPRKKKKKGMMSKIMPFMMIVPFMLQSAMIPMALTSIKFLLLKSAFLGKIAIILMIINALRRLDNGGGVYSHNVNLQREEHQKDLSKMHYGYTGNEEYGAYINKKSFS